MRVIAIGMLILPLAGCAVAAKMEARNDYRESETRYKSCLSANPATPVNCEGLRLAMEADERKFTNMGAAIDGTQSSHNVTLLGR